MNNLDNTAVSTHLGKTSTYARAYDPTLLVRELRQNNRDHLGFNLTTLPFVGVDLWNAWEVSILNALGVPINGFIKILYPANSRYIVESKSLKLYLNSFNMHQSSFVHPGEVFQSLQQVITADLSALLDTNVTVGMFLSSKSRQIAESKHVITDLFEFTTLESVLDLNECVCTQYKETPSLIEYTQNHHPVEVKYHSSLLKSNCRVTSQPDWGDIYIYYKGSNIVQPASLLKYIVSFRDECHFHEEICETVYTRLLNTLKPEKLMVTCLYLRRGGIDINPIRATSADLIYSVFTDANESYSKTLRQ